MRVPPLVSRQFLPEPLADLLQGFVGHTHNMELIDHDAGLWQHRLDGTAVGLPHVHANDLDLVALGHAHEPLRHRVLLTTGQQVHQGALFEVGQDAAVAAVQVKLINTQAARCLEAVPGRQELGLLPEDLADGLLVEACSVGYVGIGMIEGLLLDVSVQPPSHAMIVHHVRERRAECLAASSTRVASADHPEDDPLSVDREVAVSDISLAESDELTLCAALFASYGVGSIYMKVQPVFHFHGI